MPHRDLRLHVGELLPQTEDKLGAVALLAELPALEGYELLLLRRQSLLHARQLHLRRDGGEV